MRQLLRQHSWRVSLNALHKEEPRSHEAGHEEHTQYG